ncbi:MAG: Spo0B domain-containing protein [Bacillota bacterium]
MEARSILGVVRAQKHDFLNHLQVILGYLQLNKIPEARKYIEEAVFEINRLSKVNHLYFPEAALTFLVAQNEAVKRGINIEYDIQTDLNMCALSGGEISACLENILAQVIFSLSPPQIASRQIKVNLTEEPGYYACYIEFCPGDPEYIEQEVRAVNDRLAPRKGRAEFQAGGGQGVISLFFPAR